MAQADAIVLFGATGDLARRSLIPSLYFLDADHLGKALAVGASTGKLSDALMESKAFTTRAMFKDPPPDTALRTGKTLRADVEEAVAAAAAEVQAELRASIHDFLDFNASHFGIVDSHQALQVTQPLQRRIWFRFDAANQILITDLSAGSIWKTKARRHCFQHRRLVGRS